MRLFGHSVTRLMMITRYRVPASEIYRLGIIEAVTEPDDLMDAEMEMARDIVPKSPIAMKLANRSFKALRRWACMKANALSEA